MKNEKNDIVEELIPKHLVGETTSEEERRLLNWISQTEENKHQYDSLKKVFELSQEHYNHKNKETLNINLDQEWSHFIREINKTESPSVRTLQADNKITPTWYKIAAAIILLVASGFIINYFISRDNEVLYQTADNTLTVSLPDGSKVSLNRNSLLSYSTSFGERNRTVTLQGEAFFDVAHDVTHPFKIQVNNTATVEVVGTSFNVRAYDVHNEIEVIVKTGVVKLLVPDLKKEVELTAGKKGTYAEKTHELNQGSNQNINFLSWKTRKIIFEESDLSTVIETLNKTYGANITITAAPISPSCVVTVTFDHQSLEAVLHVLETTLNLTYKVNGNHIEITTAGC